VKIKNFANFIQETKKTQWCLHKKENGPHLGNLLAIIPAITLSNQPENESFLFIADFILLRK
jgi:hypothetical protein